MGNALILGRYIPGDSVLHRLDPRNKLLIVVYFIGLTFFANNWGTNGLLFLLISVGVWLAKLPIRFFLNGLRPLLWLILFTVLMQLIFTRGGHVFWQWGWLSISEVGLVNGAIVFCRFVLIVFISTLLTLTTPPLALADGIAALIKPLRWLHFPVDEIALMLGLALRFVPTLMDETSRIMDAQRSRGVDFGTGNLFQQMKALVPLLIPQFVSSFKRADELGTAMEARGYQGPSQRSHYRILQFHRADVVTVCLMLVFTIIFMVVRQFN